MSETPFAIAAAEAAVLRAPLRTPFRIASGQHDELANVFLRVCDRDGTCGWGEAAVATHITGETVAGTLANLQAAAAALAGRQVDDVAALCREFAPAFAANHAGLAALEMALLDLAARRRGLPFWRLFPPVAGLRPLPSFATDITIVIGTLEEARAAARQYVACGFTAFKIKIGRDEELDFARVLAVRDEAPGRPLVLDANMGFTAPRMLAFLDRLESRGVRPELIEQPVPKDDWAGLAEITAALAGSGILVCADESVGSLAAARRAIDSGAVSAINVKFMKSGILAGEEIARLAAAHDLPLMLGAMMESALAITASAHFACGLGGFDFIDLDTTFFLRGTFSESPYLDERGRFDLRHAGPGIGVEVPLP